ncbi:MAG: carboxylesterase/lipase family protein [Synergistaceae bacterium]|nr:carboxylesterase/lipase family protein [Synergistaceae bacterium]
MRKIFLSLLFILLIASCAQAEIISGPDVAVAETKAGKVQGYIHDGIFTYLGVKYAEAEKFMPPVKLKSWYGVKLAVTYGAVSPQGITQQEDMFAAHWYWPYWQTRNYQQDNNCLNLNIWTPGLDDKKRPVMVWLHGGGFSAGASAVEDIYNGENLSRKGDAVIVSINHRLNIYGFLDLSAYGEEYKYSGNLGVMDLVFALEWVKENIKSFGGDPDNITLFGQSGGGAKILALMETPAAKNLFNKAIIQSGAVDLMGITLPDQSTSRRIAELTLKNLNLNKSEVSRLKEIDYKDLIAAGNNAMAQAVKEGHKILSWSPVKDGDYIPDDPVAGKDAFKHTKNIPVLIGSCLNEWVTVPLFADMERTQRDNKNFWSEDKAKAKLKEKYGDKAELIAQEFLKAYPYKKFADALYVDTRLRTGALKTLNIKASQNGAKVYAYVFTWETPVMGGYAMAYHCSELPFVFNNVNLTAETVTGGGARAQALADKISQVWINFARTGEPGWEAYTLDNGATMLLDDEFRLVYNHDKELLNLLK